MSAVLIDEREPSPIGAPIFTVALAAYDAGINVIRARVDGSKAPKPVAGWGRPKDDGTRGEGWLRFQTERPDRVTVETWFANGHTGIGFVTGAISGNLEMLELEGRAVDEGLSRSLVEEANRRGLGDLIRRVTKGYCERTPSGGIHWLYYVDGAAEPNRKLAMRPATDAEILEDPDTEFYVLIETRGEGGFTVAAPSHGSTHPSGQPWELTCGAVTTIATISVDERTALFELCESFDTYSERTPPPPPPSAQRTRPPRWAGNPMSGAQYFDAVLEHLADTETIGAVLTRHGWTEGAYDGHWCRPGVDHTSAIVNVSGRLVNFSTNAPFEAVRNGGRTPTYDVLDVIAVYEYRGDRKAAARAIAESTGILAASFANAQASPPPNVDPDTGEIISVNLPPEFWEERDYLRHIRDAAWSRQRSPDAVLGVVLARGSVWLPHDVELPAIVGKPSPLSLFVNLCGPPGSGKSSAKGIGTELLGLDRTDLADGLPLGSGEGLAEILFDFVADPDDPKRRIKAQVRHRAFVYVDEGQAAVRLSERSGSTTMPTLRAIFTGDAIGNTNASTERRRIVPAGKHAYGVVFAVQNTVAAELLNGSDVGDPQRFLFLSATDPTIPSVLPAWPGPLGLKFPVLVHNLVGRCPFTVADTIVDEIRAADLARARGHDDGDPLDAHAQLVRFKIAGVLAGFATRMHIDDDDWRLAGMVLDSSNRLRTHLVTIARETARQRERQISDKLANRGIHAASKQHGWRVVEAAKRIAARARRQPGITVREVRHELRRWRDEFTEGLDHALAEKWVIVRDEEGQGDLKRTLHPGESGR